MIAVMKHEQNNTHLLMHTKDGDQVNKFYA